MKCKPFIYDNTCNEFCCCYKDAAAEYLQKKIILPVYLLSLIGEKHHADPAQHEHGPVGKTTEKNFQRMEEDLVWLSDKFDYRNKDADWKNSKDALQRGMQKLRSGYPADPVHKAK